MHRIACSLACATACAASPRPAPPPAPAPVAQTCEAAPTTIAAADHGRVPIRGTRHALYWMRLPATTGPAKGTLFYLAGGPLSHLEYLPLAKAFQKLAYPQLDVVLYDYFGFNCSSAQQNVAALDGRALAMPAMAADFIQLKRALVGNAKAYVMGGSHGAMLGAQIVADYPDDVAKAVLFSGDTESGWLAEGWFRFDAVLAGLAENDTRFAADLDHLLERASRGELAVDVKGTRHVLDRAAVEVGLWLAGGLNSKVQAALPALVRVTLDGDLDGLAAIYGAELELLAPAATTPSPTDVSAVTTFHRCNVWFPASARASIELTRRPTRFLAFRSFVHYWSELCKPYDRLGEFPFRATPPRPTAVPILAWVGDHDTFDPEATRARFARLTSNLVFDVMPGWSHDFGPNAGDGMKRLATRIKAFLE